MSPHVHHKKTLVQNSPSKKHKSTCSFVFWHTTKISQQSYQAHLYSPIKTGTEMQEKRCVHMHMCSWAVHDKPKIYGIKARPPSQAKTNHNMCDYYCTEHNGGTPPEFSRKQAVWVCPYHIRAHIKQLKQIKSSATPENKYGDSYAHRTQSAGQILSTSVLPIAACSARAKWATGARSAPPIVP